MLRLTTACSARVSAPGGSPPSPRPPGLLPPANHADARPLSCSRTFVPFVIRLPPLDGPGVETTSIPPDPPPPRLSSPLSLSSLPSVQALMPRFAVCSRLPSGTSTAPFSSLSSFRVDQCHPWLTLQPRTPIALLVRRVSDPAVPRDRRSPPRSPPTPKRTPITAPSPGPRFAHQIAPNSSTIPSHRRLTRLNFALDRLKTARSPTTGVEIASTPPRSPPSTPGTTTASANLNAFPVPRTP